MQNETPLNSTGQKVADHVSPTPITDAANYFKAFDPYALLNAARKLERENQSMREALMRARAAGISSVNYSATEAGKLARWVDSQFEEELPPPDEWVAEWVSALPNPMMSHARTEPNTRHE